MDWTPTTWQARPAAQEERRVGAAEDAVGAGIMDVPRKLLGDDADTTGAVYGQLAGAFYGEKGIPKGWRKKIAMRGVIEDYAGRLFEVGRR